MKSNLWPRIKFGLGERGACGVEGVKDKFKKYIRRLLNTEQKSFDM